MQTILEQAFSFKTAQYAAIGCSATLGYYALHSIGESLINACYNRQEEILFSEHVNGFEDPTEFVSWKRNIHEAVCIGLTNALAAQLGPWPQLNLSTYVKASFILGTTVGLASCGTYLIQRKSVGYQHKNALVDTYFTAQYLISSCKFIAPLEILGYRIKLNKQ